MIGIAGALILTAAVIVASRSSAASRPDTA